MQTGNALRQLTERSVGHTQNQPALRRHYRHPFSKGCWDISLEVTDSLGNTGVFQGKIRVFGILTVGTHGTYKDCDGLQMAFNAAQDLDEIRLEKGTYQCTGLSIASKSWENGIKISGGWDSSF